MIYMDKQQEIQQLQNELHEYMPALIPFRPVSIDIKCGYCHTLPRDISADITHPYYYPGRTILHCKCDDIYYSFCDICGALSKAAEYDKKHDEFCKLCKRYYCHECIARSYCRNSGYHISINYGQVYDDHYDISNKDKNDNDENINDRIDMLKRAIELHKTSLLKPAGRS